MSWSDVTKSIKETSGNQPVMFLSCRSGSSNLRDIKKLSADLGNRPVMASKSQVWYGQDGKWMKMYSYWSTNGVNQSSAGGTLDNTKPGGFVFINGSPKSFGFNGIPANAKVLEIHVNDSLKIARMIAVTPDGNRITSEKKW